MYFPTSLSHVLPQLLESAIPIKLVTDRLNFPPTNRVVAAAAGIGVVRIDDNAETEIIDPWEHTVEELMNMLGVTEHEARHLRRMSDPNFVGDVIALDEDGNPVPGFHEEDADDGVGVSPAPRL